MRGVDRIESDYGGNYHAGAQITAEYFGAEKVVENLMHRRALAVPGI